MRLNIFTFKHVAIPGVILTAIVFLIPTFLDIWPHTKINLGLDLQGGMHLVLEVQNVKAVEAEVERTIGEIKNELKKDDIRHYGFSRLKNNAMLVKIKGDADKSKFEAFISKNYPALEVSAPKKDQDLFLFELALPQVEVDRIKSLATGQALETIRNRVDEFGVSEPDIRVQGDDRILLQLPGIQDPERAKKLIGKTAQLTFQLVDETGDIDRPPVGSEVLYETSQTGSGAPIRTPHLIKKRVLLDGSLLSDARVEFDPQSGTPQVGIAFNRKGARLFDRITAENVNRRLAIVLDRTVYSAPVIRERISGGRASISGSFTDNEAKDLAIALRAGSLPAPVEIIEERTVGPTLGADSIRMGLMSMAVGGLMVILFMAIYYKTAGLIADLALMVNIVLIGGGLAAFGASLTLPGIAGIILTIGMAVDANVIIFERIREEYRTGKTPLASVHSGYERATLTILDANVTTFIAAIVLFQFGTGAIKGFAVTLCLGIVASLFTALVLSKTIFEFLLKNRSSSKLSI
ncbi:MAG: protein translocase subunit SecD [Desulfobacterales bacterium]|nr:protein translocase subunit SecD [Desulfobacterales bacterium]